ncbi:HAD-IIIC family phosphatase, partial [Streptomyces sp. JJ36]|uniref:HAD-IIIC family phosphatase n=1 Tax=Streptomyces sp. JJ36 TaxID=2736645 RepID=UPI001F323F55
MARGDDGTATAPEHTGTLAVVGTFTLDPVVGPLQHWCDRLGLGLRVVPADYAQVFQELLSPDGVFAGVEQGCKTVLLRAEDWPEGEQCARTAEEFADAVRAHAGRSRVPLLVLLCPPSPAHRDGRGRDAELRAAEARVEEALTGVPGVHVLGRDRWSGRTWPAEAEHYDAARDEAAHIPFTTEGCAALAAGVVRAAHPLLRTPAKVLVLDCDNTLWGGVVGEDGPDGVRIGPGYRALQEWALARQREGVLLCLASKNEDADVLRVLTGRDDMPLREEHLTARRVNWEPKPAGIAALAAELGLGLDSFVFLDDNPVEVAAVRSAHPEVLALQVPEEDGIPAFLDRLWSLDRLRVTDEDRRRTGFYRARSDRETLRRSAASFADFIASLGLRVDVGPPAGEQQRQRVSQLTFRTNQFNLSTVRRDETALRELLADPAVRVRVARVADRFGDYGLVGAAVVREEDGGTAAVLDTFLMSCRVLGRGVEHAFLSALGEELREAGVAELRAPYVPSERNTPVRRFLDSALGAYAEPREDGRVLYRAPMEVVAGLAFEPEEAEPAPAADGTASRGGAEGSGAGGQGGSAERSDTRRAGREAARRRALVDLAQDPEPLATVVRALRPAARLAAAGDGAAARAGGEDGPADDRAGRRPGGRSGGQTAAQDAVCVAVADVMGVPLADLGPHTPLAAIRMTSLAVVDTLVRLEKRFGRLPKTLFFEHRTLGEVAAAVVREGDAGDTGTPGDTGPAAAGDTGHPGDTDSPGDTGTPGDGGDGPPGGSRPPRPVHPGDGAGSAEPAVPAGASGRRAGAHRPVAPVGPALAGAGAAQPAARAGDGPDPERAASADAGAADEWSADMASADRSTRAAPAPAARDRDAARSGVHDGDPVAVVGLAGHYPGAGGAPDSPAELDALWRNVLAGGSAAGPVPADRWDHAAVHAPEGAPGRTYSGVGAFLDGVADFDALYFGIAPRDAEQMDPQQRLFLRTAVEAVQDAGHSMRTLGRDVGVYVGAMADDYRTLSANGATTGHAPYPYTDTYAIANRVSHFLDLNGPSLVVDTACSSSGVALHLACEAVRRGEVSAALAGGVNLVLHPVRHIQYAQMGMLSRGDACRPFAEGADGFVMGEGAGAVLLKPLSRALADGDHVYGLIRGSSVNSGGRTSGFTVPSAEAQAGLVSAALRSAGVDPRTIGYVEAHGSGTSLGDPVEVRALSRAFGSGGEPGRCALGSVKATIGHLEPAAGIAGLTKVLLQLRHRTLPPTPYAERPNPFLDLDGGPFRLQRAAAPWEPVGREPGGGAPPLRAGVSSFGAGGVNAHLVVEEFTGAEARTAAGAGGRTAAAAEEEAERPELYVLSAATDDRLRESARRLAARLRSAGDAVRTADVAHTLRVGREAMDVRAAFVATGRDELLDLLDRVADGSAADHPAVRTGRLVRGGPLAGLFEDLDEGREFLAGLAARGELRTLGRLWVQGAAPDWEALFPGAPGAPGAPGVPGAPASGARRTSLPPYPFEPTPYWLPSAALPQPDGAPGAVEQDATGGRESGHGDARPGRETGAAGAGSASGGAAPTGAARTAGAAGPGGTAGDTGSSAAAGSPDLAGGPATPGAPSRHPAAGEPGATAEVWAPHWVPAPLRPDGDAEEPSTVVVLDGPGSAPPLPADSGAERPWRLLHAVAHSGRDQADDLRALLSEAGASGPVLLIDRREAPARSPGPSGDPVADALPADLGRACSVGALPPLVHLRLTPDEEDPVEAAVSAFGRSVARETGRYRHLRVRLADAAVPSPAELVAEAAGNDAEVRLTADGREALRYLPADPRHLPAEDARPGAAGAETAAAGAFREGGHYLVTGGAGGIGRLLAVHLAHRYGARVTLLGRSPAGPRQQQLCDRLRALGGEGRYVQADVADRSATQAALRTARTAFGPPHGVLHAAGVLEDALLQDKSDASLARVLAPKTRGVALLDELTAGDDLDCFVLFSSVVGTLGNAGQSDYAAANAHLDAFAVRRAAAVAEGARSGRTVSLAWPLWAEGGMRLTGEAAELAVTALGLVPVGTVEALRVLEAAVRAGPPRRYVSCAGPGRTRAALSRAGLYGAEEPAGAGAEAPGADPEAVRDRVRATVAEVAGLAPERIEDDAELGSYGFNSVLLTTLANRLNQAFGLALTPVVFYEHPTVEALAGFLHDRHGTALASLAGTPAAEGVRGTGDPGTDAPAAPDAPAGPPAPSGGSAPRSPRTPAAVPAAADAAGG